jgi:hypothetical protein
MKVTTLPFTLLSATICTLCMGTPQRAELTPEGPYLGEELPGMAPKIFALGAISKAGFHLHSSLAFSPDGREVYFTTIVFEPAVQGTIMRITREGGQWSEPETAPFSGVFNDDSAVFSPDGEWLYFTSNRPVDADDDAPGDLNFWSVKRAGEGWGTPVYAGGALNSPYCDFRLSFAADGTIYLSSDREGHDSGTFNIFVSEPGPDGYTTPEKMGNAVNTPATEQIAFVAPDESYLVLYRHDRNKADDTGLYISFRGKEGGWSTARNLGPSFNSPAQAVTQAASLSPDGELIFFLRRRHEAIYWVDSKAVLPN